MGEVAVVKTRIFETLDKTQSQGEPEHDSEPESEDQNASDKETDNEKLRTILEMLDEVRLNLSDTEGQGFLFNAQHQIWAYLNFK